MKNKFREEKHIDQRLLKNGWSFRVRYNGICRSFNEKDFLSSSMAFKKAVEFRNSILVNDFIPKKEILVDTCFNEIENVYSLADETKRKLGNFYSLYVHKKNIPLVDITRADILYDLNSMVDSCSRDTISRVYSIWRKIYGVGIAKGYIDKDLTINIKCPTSKKIKANKRNEETNEQLLITLGEHLSNRLKSPLAKIQAPNILLILYYTGMRPSELFALDVNDVDFKANTIRINKRTSSSRDNKDVLVPCKTDESNRVIPMSTKVSKIIKKCVSDNSILFPNDEGKHWYSTDLGDLYHKYASEIKIDFHFYQCRHTFITNLYRKGVDIKTIQDLVGQKIDATTLGYVISSEDMMRNAISFI